ncbi:MAG: hypothetical protein ACI4EK_03900 [Wujia sp.]
MPNINRIRVNNVRYNFGTQYYDDFTMRMHGKNTLYDLANGGGKSVLMLLLMQNMIPNCTLDEKQPIEKLFRSGNGNTTIHSLVEWNLDPNNQTDGYRYMTTGFCARKAKEAEGEENVSDLASIEYFNYCIFYREFNKNDIVNLPLSKDGNRVTFTGLRNYLKELEHRDMGLMVRVFDRKGEYQRFISQYGLYESQWEIIRGINKTEGHVRTYFESNYKTTRKVVEDLLIEGIIEKAYEVKTMGETDGADTMARLLMDIKEQLTILAKKKKEITSYDHQAQLIEVLRDKVQSFSKLYEEQAKCASVLANICVTGEEFSKHDAQMLENLERQRTEKQQQVNDQKKYMDCLKIAKDRYELDDRKQEVQLLSDAIETQKKQLDELQADYDRKEAINEFLEYLETRKTCMQMEESLRAWMQESAYDENELYTYVYNIKMRMDVTLTDLRRQIEELTEQLMQEEKKQEYQDKLLHETRLALAVANHSLEGATSEIEQLSKLVSELRMQMNELRFVDVETQFDEGNQELAKIKEKQQELELQSQQLQDALLVKKEELLKLSGRQKEQAALVQDLEGQQQQYKEASEKLANIQSIYAASDVESLASILSKRMNDVILDIAALEKQRKESSKQAERLAEGRLIGVSHAAQKVLSYIETRHGSAAMYGMDYISALPGDQQTAVLNANPQIVYGVIVDDYENISTDPNLRKLDTGNVPVYIYDSRYIAESAMHTRDTVFAVAASTEYLTDAQTISDLIAKAQDEEREIVEQLEMKEEMLAAYKEDQTFVIRLSDSSILQAENRLKEALEEADAIAHQWQEETQNLKQTEKELLQCHKSLQELREQEQRLFEDQNRLEALQHFTKLLSHQEDLQAKAKADIVRLRKQEEELVNTHEDAGVSRVQVQAQLQALREKEISLVQEFENKYAPYYDAEHTYEILTMADDMLYAKFVAACAQGSADAKSLEDKRLLIDTLHASMEKMLRNMKQRGADPKELEELAARNLLFKSDSSILDVCMERIGQVRAQWQNDEKALRDKCSQADRLEGSIQYAIRSLAEEYGEYEELDLPLAEILSGLQNGEELLARLVQESKNCDQAYREYEKQQGYMLDLYKDVKRIVTTHEIRLEDATMLTEDKEQLRELFETTLMQFDRSCKALERAKNEIMKFRANTATTLDTMQVYELARSIREDVTAPDTAQEAQILTENLTQMMEYIHLERDRIEKSLSDMESMKANFEEQCLQRCLDVRTELDKLPKLSRILVDGEAISMVGLQIPYVKEEFLKQRMSDYIDRVVAQADDYEQDKDRMKFIRNSLTLKKMFGVIVTDMNAIRLNLYKRERIKEQSRYLKYEEAVGSTGQSQGIYIQFLISIINYIAGMYQVGNEDTKTKTIFIDNPFGAAKDVYIWEPIFALLAANHVQLIVPARGATPAITGRFDVNYVLGQQMAGGKQLTVVVDYTSKVDQQELEYRDLEYEQVSFDFI